MATIVTINNDPTLQLNGIGAGTKALIRGLRHSASGFSKKSASAAVKASRKYQAGFLKSTRKTYGSAGARKFYRESGLSKS